MFAEKTLEVLRRYVDEQHGGVNLRAAKALGIPNDTLDKWLKGQRDPKLFKLGPLIDKILWNHALPEKICVLEIKFPEVKDDGTSCSKTECQRLRQDLDNANNKIVELERKLIASEAIAEKLEAMMERRICIQDICPPPPKAKSSA